MCVFSGVILKSVATMGQFVCVTPQNTLGWSVAAVIDTTHFSKTLTINLKKYDTWNQAESKGCHIFEVLQAMPIPSVAYEFVTVYYEGGGGPRFGWDIAM